MKHLKFKLTLVLLAITLTLSSCYGPFRLTQNLHSWNGSLGDEWVNSLVFYGLLVVPVYEVAVTIDAVILNTIEFWTGDNPVAMKGNSKIEKLVENENGTYKIIATKNRYTIKGIEGPEKGQTLRLKIDDETRSLYLEKDNSEIKIAEFNQELSAVTLFNPDGSVRQQSAVANSPLAVK